MANWIVDEDSSDADTSLYGRCSCLLAAGHVRCRMRYQIKPIEISPGHPAVRKFCATKVIEEFVRSSSAFNRIRSSRYQNEALRAIRLVFKVLTVEEAGPEESASKGVARSKGLR